jgi:hypothetical protein
MPRLRITAGVAGWLGAIAEESRDEVQVLLVGSPEENRVEAGFITLGQENTASSVGVPPGAFAESVVEAKRVFGKPVLGMAHLHPGFMGAFASNVDEQNLVSLAELLCKPLLGPVTTARNLVLEEHGELALDPYGRKVLRSRVPGSGATGTGHRPHGPGQSVEYVETRMGATVYSVTFSGRKSPRDDSLWAPSNGSDEVHPVLYAQALEFTYCCDPECATPKKVLTDAVPVEVLAHTDGFVWTRGEIESELRQRVTVRGWGWGGYGYYGYGCGCGTQGSAGHAHVEVAPTAKALRPSSDPGSSGSATGAPRERVAIGSGHGTNGGGAASGQHYRYLTGHEDENELRAMVRGVNDEISRRLTELGRPGEA